MEQTRDIEPEALLSAEEHYHLLLENDLSDDDRKALDYYLSDLDQRERTALEEVVGNGSTLESIGKQFGVTRERVRQICTKAMRKARKKACYEESEVGQYARANVKAIQHASAVNASLLTASKNNQSL